MEFREAVRGAWHCAKRQPANARNFFRVYWNDKTDEFTVEEFVDNQSYLSGLYPILRLGASDSHMLLREAMTQAELGLAEAKRYVARMEADMG